MINSRSLDDLDPVLRSKAIEHRDQCASEGIDLLFVSTYRDYEEQDLLYQQGRTSPGAIVTNSKAGQGFHNFKAAYDAAPLVHGKVLWDEKTPEFQRMIEIGRSLGLECGADWVHFKDYDHFQYNPEKLSPLQAKTRFDSKGTIYTT